jgi:hypothetical protein
MDDLWRDAYFVTLERYEKCLLKSETDALESLDKEHWNLERIETLVKENTSNLVDALQAQHLRPRSKTNGIPISGADTEKAPICSNNTGPPLLSA